MIKKIWRVLPPLSKEQSSQYGDLSPLISHLLFHRGISNHSLARSFFSPNYDEDIHDPFLFRDMERSVSRISQAIKNKEKIIIHGDYDADGVCSSALLYLTLKRIGADASVYLPHRELEGYGMNMETIKKFVDQKVDLIITTDCGISNTREIHESNQQGIDVIVCDHHQPASVLPDAYSIIDPHVSEDSYPFSWLSGTGVAFKLACALQRAFPSIDEGFQKWLLDLVAIATIADCMPLVGENRTLVTYGLIVLRKTRRVGLQELMRLLGLDVSAVSSSQVSWRLIPIINAVGRLGHAKAAFDLLVETDREAAIICSQKLQKINEERQKMTNWIVSSAREQVKGSIDQKLLFAFDPAWPVGVVGLAAGRIAHEYSRPTFILGSRPEGIVGSGRSIPGINITDLLEKSKDYLQHFGGHEQACGFTLRDVKDLSKWQDLLLDHADSIIHDDHLKPSLNIDAICDVCDISPKLIELLSQFYPFGEGNKEPLFLLRNVCVESMSTVGDKKQHLRLQLTDQSLKALKVIGFGFGEWSSQLSPGARVDAVGTASMNTWNGYSEVQLQLEDIDIAGTREIY